MTTESKAIKNDEKAEKSLPSEALSLARVSAGICQRTLSGRRHILLCCGRSKKRAYPEIAITMDDAEALRPLEPCFGTKMTPHRGYMRLQRYGRPALEIAKQLATTPKRQKQIQQAMERCREMWRKGYGGYIPQ